MFNEEEEMMIKKYENDEYESSYEDFNFDKFDEEGAVYDSNGFIQYYFTIEKKINPMLHKDFNIEEDYKELDSEDLYY